MKGISKKELDTILEWFNSSDLSSASIECDEKGGYKVKLSRLSSHHVQNVAQTIPSTTHISVQKQDVSESQDTNTQEQQSLTNQENTEEILAPIVGTFYRSSSPDVPAFVQAGDKVKKGEVLCILEAMKVMNELEAEFDMEIVDVLVENATLVEYNQPIFKVIPL